MKLSAVVLTWNEEKYIDRCLSSMEGIVDDIIVVDSFSTDKTRDYAELYASVVTSEYDNTRDQRNFGLSLCSHDWRLLIDADEFLSPSLQGWLKTPGWLEGHPFDVLEVPRHNVVDGVNLGYEKVVHFVRRGIEHTGHPLHADRCGPNRNVGQVGPNSCCVEHHKTGLEWMQAARMYWYMCPYTFDQVGRPPGSEDLEPPEANRQQRQQIDVWNEYIKTPAYRKLTGADIKNLVVDQDGWHRREGV